MLNHLCQNTEINLFLQNFSPDYWKIAIEAASLCGIRKIYSQSLPINKETLENILDDQYPLKGTLNSMKEQLKCLNSTIKKLERRTKSSSDLARDFDFRPAETLQKKSNECSLNKSLKCAERSAVVSKKGGLSFRRDIKEPKCCALYDAKRIISAISKKRGLKGCDGLSVDFFRSRETSSTQENSWKGTTMDITNANITFGK